MSDRQTYQMRVDPKDLARWRRQAKRAGMSLAAAVRAALDAYFGEPDSPSLVSGAHTQAMSATGKTEARDRVAALRGAVPGLRRATELPGDPGPDEVPPRSLSSKARQRIVATAQANDAMNVDQLVAVLGPLLPGEDRRAIRALVEGLRDGA